MKRTDTTLDSSRLAREAGENKIIAGDEWVYIDLRIAAAKDCWCVCLDEEWVEVKES